MKLITSNGTVKNIDSLDLITDDIRAHAPAEVQQRFNNIMTQNDNTILRWEGEWYMIDEYNHTMWNENLECWAM